ncbi:hypothetical protein Tcan_11788 [Toxocara canis]|uniref:Uncharacterized protein n=1 Tax=Toxocara canis TaxID=6265 RepID=A0A0B2VDX0_TOXCA|nr:hypothetical protein Tcan_11788 [Toxocara canis]
MYSALRGEFSDVDGPDKLTMFCAKVYSSATGSVPGLIASTIFNALPISMIVIGVQKLDECPAQPYIPIWMIITGAIFIARYLADIGVRIGKVLCKLDEYHGNVYLNPVDWLFAGIFAITLCVGTYWVYSTSADVQLTMREYSDYCDRILYGMAFVIVCIFCSIIALFSLCCCGCCVYVLYK